jgi:hypothetical protein
MLCTKLPRNLKSTSLCWALMLEFSFYFGYQEYWTKESVLDCGEPHYQCEFLEERTRESGSSGLATVGVLGKAHKILAVVNNCQEDHLLTMLETSGTVTDQTLSILIDPGATEILISGAMLKRIKVKVVKQDEFSFVEMSSGAKQKVGGKVMGCTLNMGEFVTRTNLYVMILGYYDVMIGMDWFKLDEVILNCKMK